MKRFEMIQSPQDEGEIGKGGSGADKTLEIIKVDTVKNDTEGVEEEVEYSEAIESLGDIIGSKKEIDTPAERQKMLYIFDIRYKHPDSQMYQDGRFNNDVLESRKNQENVFSHLDQKDLEIDGKIVGKFTVKSKLSPSCTYVPERTEDGKYQLAPDCGWFFQLTIRVNAKDVDLAEATRSVLKAIGNTSVIDYMDIDKGIPVESVVLGGYSIKRNIKVDVSELKGEGK